MRKDPTMNGQRIRAHEWGKHLASNKGRHQKSGKSDAQYYWGQVRANTRDRLRKFYSFYE